MYKTAIGLKNSKTPDSLYIVSIEYPYFRHVNELLSAEIN
jgi:hypothetical protein